MAVVTTGFFDGVHLGHRHVLETVVSSARERGEEAVVVTFWPHPRAVLQQDARDFRLLSSLQEKKERLLAAGIDRVEVLPFTREFAAMTAADYLEMLRVDYGAALVVMGYDNRIGSDLLTAEQLCASQAVASRPLPCVLASRLLWAPPSYVAEGGHGPAMHTVAQPSLSSTQIRRVLSEGRVKEAAAMLGYSYQLYGVVVSGNRMGRTIGFPTANMQLYEPLKLLPSDGVYVVDVEVLGRQYRGMCNIGIRPTVDGKARTIETHILDFNQDIYGLPLRLSFVSRLREERKFPSLEALKAQLQLDREACR